jgi:diguanylate cyclase (GGDEF)-like protein
MALEWPNRLRLGGGATATSAAPRNEPAVMARALGWLYLAGATIGLISLLLPHAPEANEGALYTNVAVAYVGGALVLALAERLPGWFFHVALISGIALISRAIYYSGEPGSLYTVWYVWVGLYAFYFFTRIQATAHLALVGAAYAALLYHEPGDGPLARWLTTVATLVVAGFFIDALARRLWAEAHESNRTARNLATVADVMHELGRAGTSAIRPSLCETILRICDAGMVALYEPAADGSGLVVTASAGLEVPADPLPFVGTPSGTVRAFTSGEARFISDAAGDPELNQELVQRTGAVSCLWQPIIRDAIPVAVLAVGWNHRVARPTDDVAALVGLLAAEGAIVLERADLQARLERMARTDDLTGLPNRRAWDEELPREQARARRSEEPLSVAILDLDAFKQFNDSLGHQAGDRLLKQVASAWRSGLRLTDVLARLGGDEFGAVLPACSPAAALALVERLCRATPASQTCSAGVATWDGTETVEALVARADGALYQAKVGGRNRVETAG